MLTNRQLFLKHIGQTSPFPMMLEISGASGVFLSGPDGKKYLDLISGVSVSNTGHCHPRVVEAIRKQAGSYTHLMVYGEMIQGPQVEYAAKLASVLPSGLSRCYFVNSGSEAVEASLKLAKRYTGRYKIVYFNNAYHGSTHGALSVQGSEFYRSAFRPLLPGTYKADFNDESSLNIIDSSTACVIVEPVQGEAGVIYPEKGFLSKIRSLCNDTGALLVFDEVQTGFGRTGHLFALEKFGVIPDILLLAKALGGGMPLGAFLASEDIMRTISIDPVLGHITTFGGHPVSCAAGLASLEVIIEEDLAKSALSRSHTFRKLLVHPLISEIRGEGLLLAVKLTDHSLVPDVIAKAPEFGLILDYFLFCNDSFRIAPPLVITEEETVYACGQLLKLLDKVAQKSS